MTKAEQICIKAAAIIDKKGLYKGNFRGPNGSRCISGALSDVDLPGCRRTSWSEHAERIIDVLTIITGFSSIPTWNDRPQRTKDEVVRALLDVAGFLRSNP